MRDQHAGGGEFLLEFGRVYGEIARLRERFYVLQVMLAAQCPACKGARGAPQLRCRTCGGKGRLLPLFSVQNRLVYQDSLGNLVELSEDGTDPIGPTH